MEAKNIYQKMSAITNELGVVAKNLSVDMGGGRSYKAVQEKDILDAVKPLEEKYGVYSYPMDSNITESDILVKESEYNGKTTKTNTLYMRLERTYRFVNIDKPDEYVDIKSYGDGLDTGDKAPGKAMTYADKYALMKAYKIATGDDPDKDASPENGYSKTNKETYREKLIKYCNENKLDLTEISKDYSLSKTSTESDYKKAYEDLTK
jgi:hypothetical protein